MCSWSAIHYRDRALGLLFFLKSMGHGGHMRDIIPRNCCVKGFFTEVNGFTRKCLGKKTKKIKKIHFTPQ